VQAVVKPTAKVMGMGKLQSPGAQKPLNGYWWILEYITTLGCNHTCKSIWRCDNMGGLGEHVTCHMLRFLSTIPFSFNLILQLVQSPHRLTDFDDLRWLVSRQGNAFWGSQWYGSPFRGSSPKNNFGAWIGVLCQTCEIENHAYYRNYCIDCNQILHSDKDHQMLSVGGPNTRITNPRWRTAAILEK